MKRIKILPSIFMLVLCLGAMAIGVFAITPTKNTISGSMGIGASNPETIISVYALNKNGERKRHYMKM